MRGINVPFLLFYLILVASVLPLYTIFYQRELPEERR
jgi:hypothetical protein